VWVFKLSIKQGNMVDTLIGQKKRMRQVWTQAGARLAVTEVSVKGNVAVRTVSQSDNDTRMQIGFGAKKLKNIAKATVKQLEAAGLQEGKRIFKEVQATQDLQLGQEMRVEDIFQVGDIIKVTGTTKGKGFAGVVKRWGFAGGPATHGQSDRERAPGAIGQRSTPGHVFKNKKMPGHMGNATQTLETCQVVAVDTEKQSLWIKGTLPGSYNSLLTLHKGMDSKEIALNAQSLSILDIKPVMKQEAGVEEEVTDEAQTSPEVTESAEATQEAQA
jgi:large subunit ribosomal protein L3